MNDHIPCTECDHVSDDFIAAWEHRSQHRGIPRQPLMQKGMRVTVIHDGKQFTDVVTDVVFDPKTGDEKVIMDRDPLPRAVKMLKNNRRLIDQLVKPAPFWKRWWRKLNWRRGKRNA